MSFPDFREALIVEIELARQINAAASGMLPRANGGLKRADLSGALGHIAIEHINAISCSSRTVRSRADMRSCVRQ
jgi:hypothetical protein